MQIHYNMGTHSLLTYVLMEDEREWIFPDFSDKCPLCGAPDCAYHYAVYTRKGININGKILVVVVARYLCRSKGVREIGTDRTFSLLPSCLMPYRRPHLQIVQMLLYYWMVLGKSIEEVLGYAADEISEGFYPDISFLYKYKVLFLRSLVKFNFSESFQEKIYSDKNRTALYYFLEQINVYKYNQLGMTAVEGIEGISLAYYHKEGGWEKNSHFLFGTAYQHGRRQ